MPLPPLLRRVQQSYYWQFICLPVLIGFGGALVANGCLAHGLFDIDPVCLKTALSSTILSFLTVLISGHSPNSASFNSDGTENQVVKQVSAQKP